jgi:Aspartyl/Asparaginyl beta-hydroxylase
MEIGYPYKILGKVDISSFIEFLNKNNSAWPTKQNDLRSTRFQTHEFTRSILFKWTERDAWPILEPKEYDTWNKKQNDIKKLCSQISNAQPLNFMITELEPKSEIHEHYDAHPFFAWARRIHVPLYVPTGVQFILDGVVVPMEAGKIIEISNTRYHKVINPTDESRYHIIMDFAP